jgi:hypothetical protein
MRGLPRAIPFLIAIIALDFTLAFGLEAWRIFASPVGGLELPSFASMVYALGKFAGLTPSGLIKLAALFGMVYLTIAVMCVLHLASRLGAFRGRPVDHQMLDAALILVAVSTLAAATPAILQGATEILIMQRLPLWLIGLAATLSMVERLSENDRVPPPGFWERRFSRMMSGGRHEVTIYIAPAVRREGATLRWNNLRREAGMKQRAIAGNAAGFVMRRR